MLISVAKEKLENSKLAKQYTPTLMAVVILLGDEVRDMEASQVCSMLGVPDSYKHTVRALLQVPEIMKELA